MYVPLGGRNVQIIALWIIFTFIGLWHDLQLRWLAWSWINCIFFSLEIIVITIFNYFDKKVKILFKKFFYLIF